MVGSNHSAIYRIGSLNHSAISYNTENCILCRHTHNYAVVPEDTKGSKKTSKDCIMREVNNNYNIEKLIIIIM